MRILQGQQDYKGKEKNKLETEEKKTSKGKSESIAKNKKRDGKCEKKKGKEDETYEFFQLHQDQ